MYVFLDFEASSLSRDSYPIEVAWVFADGRSESHLIRPSPEWNDWDPEAQALHHISRERLDREGSDPVTVAKRMLSELRHHDLLAGSPVWDGRWMAKLMDAGGLARDSLQLRGSEEARKESARFVLADVIPEFALTNAVEELLVLTEFRRRAPPACHRARADAEEERRRWLATENAAWERCADLGALIRAV